MKKLLSILSLGAVASTLALGAAIATAKGVKELEVAADGDPETYIPMTTSFFTDWTNDAGDIKNADATFWGEGYSFEALDNFYSGESKEGWTGTLTSRTWKQYTQYVYFTLGAAKDYVENPVHLVFHYGDQSENFYNNTFVENPMTLRYFKVPDQAFASLDKVNGFDMYVEIVDTKSSDYGFASFGYLHVNQTIESTGDAMRYFLNNLSTDSREWEVNKRKQIMNTYFDNEAQREVFFHAASNIDDTFSSNADFLNHWYFDYNFFNNDYGAERHFDKAIGTDEYRPDANTNMPFNNDGGFFRGWYEGSVDAGFVASDGLRYRFVSRPFVLSGTGLISIKMAGKASLHVIDATAKNTDSQAADLAWIDNKGFKDSGSQSNMAESGFNTTAMVKHVINLEAYLGKKIQLAICDYDTSGWSAAYFDTLVSNYASRPAFGVEYATQVNNNGTFYPVYKDIYMNSTIVSEGNPLGIIYNGSNGVNTADENAILNHVDNTASKEAYGFFASYLDTLRSGATNACNEENAVKGLLADYNELSSDARALVDASDDYNRLGSNWYSVEPEMLNMGESIQYFAKYFNTSINSSLFNFFAVEQNSSITVAVVFSIAFVAIALLTIVIVIKKRIRIQ